MAGHWVSNPLVRRSVFALALILALLWHASDHVRSQARPLLVVSASPVGEVAQLIDANEIRIVFSEPMVDVGAPVTAAPAWLSATPALRASYYWSGTRTLIVTADPDTPLPFATKYTVTVAATARSAAGHAIASPYSFAFTTPTVRLLGADWYRKTGRADSPAVIALRFNQPVRPADVLAHATARYAPHQWTRPTLSAPARARLSRDDKGGLARFDDKVERIARVAASTDQVALQAAASWDEKRFPPAPGIVVLETQRAPSTDGWLNVTVDGGMPSPDGPETHAEQSSVVRFEPTFFVEGVGNDVILFTRGVAIDEATRVLSVSVLDGGGSATPVARIPPAPPLYSSASGYTNVSLLQIGYPRQPPACVRHVPCRSVSTSTDGQVLGYPWLADRRDPARDAVCGVDRSGLGGRKRHHGTVHDAQRDRHVAVDRADGAS